jgi:NAD(P)-dependent dehydrogenase (short-subunit alcohol dehydrogenase family)
VAAEVGGTPWVADARDRTAAEETVKAAERALGRIDGLVDVVGMSRFAALLNLSDEDFDWTFDMVLRHVYLFTQVIGRSMVASRNGTMVFVSSVAGFSSAPRHAAYGAAKAGLNSLVRSAAVELGPHRVRVNAVAPGVVRTPRVTEALGGERLLAEFAEQIPLGSVAQMADIAAAILFLSSRLASHITGQTLVVDGGASVQYPYPSRLLP